MDENKLYDEIVRCIMTNVVAEANRTNGKIVLWDFNEKNPNDKLYYTVACMVSDIFDDYKKIYIQMPFISYLKFKYHNRNRKNLRWLSRNCDWLTDENKTSVYIIMDFIRESYDLEESIFADILKEYYGQE